MNNTLEIIAVHLFSILILAMLSCALLSPGLIFVFRLLALVRKKIFYHHLAGQICRSGWWCGSLVSLSVLVILIRGYCTLFADQPFSLGTLRTDLADPALPLNSIILCACLSLVFMFCLSLVRATWVRWRAHSVAQILLAALNMAGGLTFTASAWLLFTSMPWMLPVPVSTASFILFAGLPHAGDPCLIILAAGLKTLGGTLALTINLALGFLLLRRGYDDLGRDYYNFAIRHGAWWMAACTVLAALGALAPSFIEHGFYPDARLRALIPYACCLVFWISLLRSHTPLRHKIGIWFSLLIMGLALITDQQYLLP